MVWSRDLSSSKYARRGARRELAVTQVFRHHYPDNMVAGTMTVAMHGTFTVKGL
jgi:hypothetical protein